MSSTAPLVNWPQFSRAPEHLLRGLRDVRSNAELLYDGHGHWMLGEVRPNDARTKKAMKMLQSYSLQKHPNPAGINKALLMVQGFVLIRDYFGEPSGRIVEDYKRMCWKEQNGVLDREIRGMLEESKTDPRLKDRIDKIRERINQEARSDHRFFFRKPVSITVPGWIKKIFTSN